MVNTEQSLFPAAAYVIIISRKMTTDNASTEPLKADDEIAQLKVSLQREKAAKRKMYSYLVKIADELKSLVSHSVYSSCYLITSIKYLL